MLGRKDYCTVDMLFSSVYAFIDRVTGYKECVNKTQVHKR